MFVYNFSRLKQRDQKIYNIGGYNFANGISFNFLMVVAPVAIILILLFFLLSLAFGLNYFNPMAENFSAKYTIITLALSIGAGCALWFIRVSTYRLYEYLLAYIKPKKSYTNDFKLKEYKFTNVKIDSKIKHIL